MYSRILVPFDGSPLAAQALPYAQVLAGALSAEVVLLQALAKLPDEVRAEDEKAAHESVAVESDTAKMEESWEESHERARQGAVADLESAAATLREAGLSVRTLIREGDPAETIAEEAGADDRTLIAMTTHGRSGIGRWVVGSVTDKVVRMAGTPTLVIRNQEDTGSPGAPDLRRVVLPLDGSFLAEQAIPHAVALAKALGAQVETVRALSMPMYMPAQYPVAGGIPSPGFQPRGEAEKYLEGIVERLRAEGAPMAEPKTVWGDGPGAIIDAAESAPDSLVVMCTHGRSGVGRWLMGSVADRVVRHSGRPVLLVRAKEEAAQRAA